MKMAVDAIAARRSEAREERLSIVEAETRAVMTTIMAAAGNEAGMQAASKFRLFGRGDEPEEIDRVDIGAVAGTFGGKPLYSAEDIERAKAARR